MESGSERIEVRASRPRPSIATGAHAGHCEKQVATVAPSAPHLHPDHMSAQLARSCHSFAVTPFEHLCLHRTASADPNPGF